MPEPSEIAYAALSQQVSDVGRRMDTLERQFERARDTIDLLRPIPVQISAIESTMQDFKVDLATAVKTLQDREQWRESYRLQREDFVEKKQSNLNGLWFSIISVVLILAGIVLSGIVQLIGKAIGH